MTGLQPTARFFSRRPPRRRPFYTILWAYDAPEDADAALMKFRLVIHIPSEAGLERGALMKLEGAIVRVLAPQHSVHGRDLGPSHLILTIDSDAPEATWETAKGAIPEPTVSRTYVFYALIDGPKGRGTEHWLWPPVEGDAPPRRD